MKKFILTVAMLLATGINAMAEGAESNEMNRVEAYNVEVNINGLARYLELTDDQIDGVESIQNVFSESLKYAASIKNDESRKKMVRNTIYYDLSNMRYILTEEQYKKYRRVLNATLENRNIDWK